MSIEFVARGEASLMSADGVQFTRHSSCLYSDDAQQQAEESFADPHSDY